MKFSLRIRDQVGGSGPFRALILAGLLDLLAFVAVVLQVRPSFYQVPLRYSREFGVEATGPWYTLFYLPLVGFVIIIVNIAVLGYAKRWGRVWSYYLAGAAILTELLILIATLLFLGRI